MAAHDVLKKKSLPHAILSKPAPLLVKFMNETVRVCVHRARGPNLPGPSVGKIYVLASFENCAARAFASEWSEWFSLTAA